MVVVLALATGPVSAAGPTPDRVFHSGTGGLPPCAKCHGAGGTGDANGAVPALAGQSEAYLAKQLADFKQGKRQSEIMGPIARQLTDRQLSRLAEYAAQLPPPSPAGESDALGQRLATIGKWQTGVPPCDDCHGPGGRGIPPHFPALAGQQAAYVGAAMAAFRSGTRSNDPLGLMTHVAERLTAEEVTAVARHFQATGRTP